jgi:hypothetical protein
VAKNQKKRSRVSKPKPKDIGKIFGEGTLIDKAVSDAAREALRFHKRIGNPVAQWRDGKDFWVQPEDIQVD